MTELIFDIESSFDENLKRFRDDLELIDKALTDVLFNHMDILKETGSETHRGRADFNKRVLVELEKIEQ